MAKKEFAKNEKKSFPFTALRKGALCALIGTTALAGGLLVGCDEEGKVTAPAGVNFYYGETEPDTINNPGKVGDFYIETGDGDIWRLSGDGWEKISNIKGPQGDPGYPVSIEISDDGYWVIGGIKSNVKAEGTQGEPGEPGAPGETVSVEISDDGFWVIGGTKTDKKAIGVDGTTPAAPVITISEDGYWEIDGEKTSTKATGEKGETGEQGNSVTNVSVVPGFDLDGNMYMDMTFHYSNETTTTERVYPNQTIYVGEHMTLQEAVNEIAVGGTIVLKNDIVLDEIVKVNRQAKIDLAGHIISNTTPLWNDTEDVNDWSLISVREGGDLTIVDSGVTVNYGTDDEPDYYTEYGGMCALKNDCYAIDVQNGGKLTIEGEGTIDAECKSIYKMAIWADGGEVVINGGTFTNSSTDGTDTQYDLIYVKNGGTITINGGTFDCKTPRWTINSKNDLVGTVVVKGGTFKNYNPSESMTDENAGNVPPTNFVAEGYAVVSKVVGEDTWYTVDKLENIIANAEAGATINLASDVVIDAQLNIDKEITLDLNGHTISNTEDVWDTTNKEWSLLSVNGGNLTIKNGTLQAKADDCYAIDVRNGGTLVIESGKYVGNVHAIYVHDGSLTVNGGEFDIQQLSEVTGDSRYTLNCLDENYKNGTATIVVNGGKFANYNPEGSTSEYPTVNFLANGYTVETSTVGEDTWYTVVEDAE